MSEEYYERMIKDLKLKIEHLEYERDIRQKQIEQIRDMLYKRQLDDYDRLYGDLTYENVELKQEIERLNNIIKEVREYIESYNLEYLHEKNEHKLADILEELLEILDKEK